MCAMRIIVKPNKVTKMQKATGKFVNHPTKTGKQLYDKFYFYVPTQVAKDGTFPFKVDDRVEVEIKGKTVVITKAKD
jgi:hypothetical protein